VRIISTLVLAPALAGASLAQSSASAFDARLVPAEVGWVAHLDVAGLRSTVLFREARARCEGLDLESGLEDLEEVRVRYGFDVLQDVSAATVYGSLEESDAATIVLQTNEHLDTALERLHAEGLLAGEREGELSLLRNRDGEDSTWAYAHRVEGEARRLVVVSDDRARVVAGARALRGEAATLAQGAAPWLGPAPRAGTFLYVATAGTPFGLAELGEESRFAARTQGILVEIGETKGQLFLRVDVTTEGTAEARDLTDTLIGLRALGRLFLREAAAEAQPLLDLADACHLEARGSIVHLEFEHDSLDLIRILEQVGSGW
jgi:hypothetical protein